MEVLGQGGPCLLYGTQRFVEADPRWGTEPVYAPVLGQINEPRQTAMDQDVERAQIRMNHPGLCEPLNSSDGRVGDPAGFLDRLSAHLDGTSMPEPPWVNQGRRFGGAE